MTKNQKIALGCGGAGCLGLIVLAIVGGVGYLVMRPAVVPARSYSINSNSNTNSNNNQNPIHNTNESANTSSSNSSSGSSSYSDDEKHRLFQAASMTQDADVVQNVVKKLGLFKANGTPADDYPQFIKDHIVWGASNSAFITSLDTPEKARAYVDAHL